MQKSCGLDRIDKMRKRNRDLLMSTRRICDLAGTGRICQFGVIDRFVIWIPGRTLLNTRIRSKISLKNLTLSAPIVG